MADVALSIGGRRYTVSCRDGEEMHLREIGALVDARTRDAKSAVGEGLGEARQLLFAALLLADEVKELRGGDAGEEETTEVEALTERLEALSRRLAPGQPNT